MKRLQKLPNENVCEFQGLERKERKEVIAQMRKEGIPIRKIARMTAVVEQSKEWGR